MHHDPAESVLFTVMCFGVGGSLLALAGLWLELRGRHRYGTILAGILLPLFVLAAIVSWAAGQPMGVVGPLMALSAACLAAGAMRSSVVRKWARLLGPRLIWGLLLVVSPIFSVVYAYCRVNSFGQFAGIEYLNEVAAVDLADVCVETDHGRKIDVFIYRQSEGAEAAEDTTLSDERLAHEVIRLAGPDPACNCHGWVFTGGKYGVPGESVDAILSDNGYTIVRDAAEGDLIVYRDAAGEVLHTGLVRLVGADGLILVESKWGPLGLYLHPPKAQPWGHNITYYRSARQGHLLKMSPAVTEKHARRQPIAPGDDTLPRGTR